MCGNIYPAKEKNKKQEKNPAYFVWYCFYYIGYAISQKNNMQI